MKEDAQRAGCAIEAGHLEWVAEVGGGRGGRGGVENVFFSGAESALFFLVVGDTCQDSELDLQINIIFSTPLQNKTQSCSLNVEGKEKKAHSPATYGEILIELQ